STTPWRWAGRSWGTVTGPAARRPPPTTWPSAPVPCGGSPASRCSRSACLERSALRLDGQGVLLGEDLIDQAVGYGVLAAQDEVAVDVDRDLLDGLAGVRGQGEGHPFTHQHHLLDRQLHVLGLALGAAVRLVDQH